MLKLVLQPAGNPNACLLKTPISPCHRPSGIYTLSTQWIPTRHLFFSDQLLIMRSILPAVVALVAYGSLGACQSSTVITQAGATATIVSGIDPSDIAAIPEPEELGPPVGVPDAVGLDYDAAAVTASVLAVVVAATDAQTAVVAAATSSPASDVSRRSYVGSNTNLQRRDRSYPIDTSSYVSIALGCCRMLVTNYQKGHPKWLHSRLYQLSGIHSEQRLHDLQDPV